MEEIERSAEATWDGELRDGGGEIGLQSGTLKGAPYNYTARFEGAQEGTNPEELLAAAHAASYSMVLAATLTTRGYQPIGIQTRAVATLSSEEPGAFAITKMRLETSVQVADLEEEEFQRLAYEAKAMCPISNALRSNVEIELDVTLFAVPAGVYTGESW